jgi:hypothetical protein
MNATLEISGLDPEVALVPRLLETRWIAPDGEVIPYQPPAESPLIIVSDPKMPSPPPTAARLNKILKAIPTETDPSSTAFRKESILLFGAWTSDYERFRTTRGHLEMRVQLNFYTHETGSKLALHQPEASDHSSQLTRLKDTSLLVNSLKAQTEAFSILQRWHLSNEDRWSYPWGWMLYHERTGWREGWRDESSRHHSLFNALVRERTDLNFRIDKHSSMGVPLPDDHESLQLVQIKSRYLGSSEVELTIEDFALVTEESIQPAQKDDK